MNRADARVRWQCRRGMRELDQLLTDYFEHSYGASSEAEKAAFCELLTLPDPDLIKYLVTGQAHSRGVFALVIERIRSGAGTGAPPP
jgi:antitoxin CptB